MNDNGQEFTGLNYEMLVEDSLRMVVRSALRITEMSGLPGETHFYIGFRTDLLASRWTRLCAQITLRPLQL